MRKPQCTVVHEDFRIKRNAESTLLSRPREFIRFIMKLTYIYHSGFVVETGGCILVFDFWKDPAGVMPGVLESDKPLYVFSSHF